MILIYLVNIMLLLFTSVQASNAPPGDTNDQAPKSGQHQNAENIRTVGTYLGGKTWKTLRPPHPDVARPVLRWVAGREYEAYNKNMRERAEQYNKLENIEELGFPHWKTIKKNTVKHSRLADEAWKRAEAAGKLNRVIASTVREVKTTPRPRFNDLRRWGHKAHVEDSKLERVSFPSDFSRQTDPAPPKSSRTHKTIGPRKSRWYGWSPNLGGEYYVSRPGGPETKMRPEFREKWIDRYSWMGKTFYEGTSTGKTTSSKGSLRRSQSLGGFSLPKSSRSSLHGIDHQSATGKQSPASRLSPPSQLSPAGKQSPTSERSSTGRLSTTDRLPSMEKQSPVVKQSSSGSQVSKTPSMKKTSLAISRARSSQDRSQSTRSNRSSKVSIGSQISKGGPAAKGEQGQKATGKQGDQGCCPPFGNRRRPFCSCFRPKAS